MKQKSWISIVFSFASQCRGKIVLSVLCAIISVIAGLIPYWSVYQIITLFIGGSPVMAEAWRWCWIGLGTYAIKISAIADFPLNAALPAMVNGDIVSVVKASWRAARHMKVRTK